MHDKIIMKTNTRIDSQNNELLIPDLLTLRICDEYLSQNNNRYFPQDSEGQILRSLESIKLILINNSTIIVQF